jgi:hypothetical protein
VGLFGRRKKNVVRGTARVVTSSRAPHGASYGNLIAQVVVEAPGLAPYSLEYRKLVTPVNRWPHAGTVLPIEVDPSNPGDIDVLWDEVPKGWDVARNQAEQMAALMRQQQAGAQQAPPGGVPADAMGIVSQIQQMFPGAQVSVDGRPSQPGQTGTGQQAPPPPPPGAPPAGGPVQVVAANSDGDPVERLGKLAKLREAGIIDDAQFEQLKAQILGQAGI